MKQEILDYLDSQRVGVLAVEMLDGSPHGAAVHYSYAVEPFQFFMETPNTSKKVEAILNKEFVRASFVVGCDLKNMKTLQMDGIIRLVKKEEIEVFNKSYFTKFPNKKEKELTSDIVFITFIPKWWRFTDWTNPQGEEIILSE